MSHPEVTYFYCDHKDHCFCKGKEYEQQTTQIPDFWALQKNNELIKGNMKMNAELIEAINALSTAVKGLQTGDATSAETSSEDDTAVLLSTFICFRPIWFHEGWEQDVIGGFNTFIKEQEKEKDDCSVTLARPTAKTPTKLFLMPKS